MAPKHERTAAAGQGSRRFGNSQSSADYSQYRPTPANCQPDFSGFGRALNLTDALHNATARVQEHGLNHEAI